MTQPRSAGELGPEFPYTLGMMCYIEVDPDGAVTWGGEAEAYERALRGQSRLYAVWPGEWASTFAAQIRDQRAGSSPPVQVGDLADWWTALERTH